MTTLRIARRAADRLHAGHLWVYRTDLETKQDAEPTAGALVTLTSAGKPLGTAIYSTASQIAARLISPTPDLTRQQYLDDLRQRIAAALQLRHELAPVTAANNAHRLLFSEADNLPGILADRYNDLVLLQLLTQSTAQDDVRATIVAALREGLDTGPLTIWERPDPRIRELEQLPPPPPGPLFTSFESCHLDRSPTAPSLGEVERSASPPQLHNPPTTTTFTLNNLRFTYDAAAGQKTGAFLDQRLNYAAATSHVQASGRTARALDICTYQGGFALHLAQVCDRVTGVDSSRAALEAADQNLTLNPHLKATTDWIEADAFDYLRHLDTTRSSVISTGGGAFAAAAERPASLSSHSSNLYDAIVLDPPAFAKSKRAADAAARGYKELNLRALRLLTPGGTLITNSCSHHVSLEDFTAIVASAAADAGRRVQLLETRAAAPDHPELLTLPETRYLKCLICRVD